MAGFASRLLAIDMEAAWRADCAMHGTPGQHSDSDVQAHASLSADAAIQQPPSEEAVKKMNSKEQMAARLMHVTCVLVLPVHVISICRYVRYILLFECW